jgi:NAD+ kinase
MSPTTPTTTSTSTSATPPATTAISRVGVVTKPDLGDCADVLDKLATWLQSRGMTVLFDEQSAALGGPHHTHMPADQLVKTVDLIVLLGGDGTLLLTADRVAMAGAQTPILGVNFGSLGFLTEVRLQELYDILELVLAGSARIDERAMLHVEILSAADVIVQDVCVLNDVVITRGALSRMTDLSVSVNDQFVARFKADGLIVATATGSTAYNLSAGGPIVHPGVDALVITPIAPHTLTNRPVVIPINSRLVIHPLRNADHQDVFVTFDGQIGHPLPPDHHVRVTRATQSLRLVRPTARSYYEVLREKLKWAER